MGSDRVIVEGIKVAKDLLRQNLTSDAQSYRCRGSSTLPRTRAFAGDTISVGAQQRHSSHVCVARGRARTLRSIPASSRNHKSAVGHSRRSAPEPSLGSPRQLPYDLRAILKQALTRALAERANTLGLLAELRRLCADLTRQRCRKVFLHPVHARS